MDDFSSPASRPPDAGAWVALSVSELPAGEAGAVAQFAALMMPLLAAPRAGSPALWRGADDLLESWRFFRSPPAGVADGCKVAVEPRCAHQPELPSTCVEEGTLVSLDLADTPFALDAVRRLFKQRGHAIHAQSHTVLGVDRPAGDGAPRAVLPPGNGTPREMFALFLVEPMGAATEREALQRALHQAVAWVKGSVEDFPAMGEALRVAAVQLDAAGAGEEGRFLRWALEDNFVFMGLACWRRGGAEWRVESECAGLGAFRPAAWPLLAERMLPGVTEALAALLSAVAPAPPGERLELEYWQPVPSARSAVGGVDLLLIHPPVPPTEEPRLMLALGRFSRGAMAGRASSAALLDRRLALLLEQTGLPPDSYWHRELRLLFDRLPLRELFHMTPAELARLMPELLQIQGEADVRLIMRLGARGRDWSALAVFSRGRYRAGLEEGLAALLSRRLAVEAVPESLTEAGALTALSLRASWPPGRPANWDLAALEEEARELVMTWEDKLRRALLRRWPQREAFALFARYARAFEPFYREAVSPEEAAEDVDALESLRRGERRLAARVRAVGDSSNGGGREGGIFVTLYGFTFPDLTRLVQTFHNLGVICLQELSSQVVCCGGEAALRETGGQAPTVRIQRFNAAVVAGEASRLIARQESLELALAAIQEDRLHDDGLNQLALLEGFSPRELTVIRGLRQYHLQIFPGIARTAIDRVLTLHHALARLLLEGFLARFDPEPVEEERARREGLAEARFEAALAEVPNLQEDRILRGFWRIIAAMLRTNFFLQPPPEALSFKIDPGAMPGLPAPQPWRAIFVLAPHMEGIHLRGGPVARGGIRHSDRLEDYRTEALGLMKTQMVKNTLIVPVGAKGAFIAPPPEDLPAAARGEWTAGQYQRFIRGLLDLTDNRREGRVVHPPRVVPLDGEDPYLVVAADKGTATFSDLANRIAQQEYGFWLGDAFASGGSHGYDHKKVGITARGAWECVKLHFWEMGRDIQNTPFTVVGIGDMSGDVFGNGMLLSPHIRLLGAFNHQHVFLDPEPDPERSLVERRRLFDLPRSGWNDYDPAVISPGGGVFPRGAKGIPLNDPLRRLLETDAEALPGEEVIRRLLCLPVDLLYNGGIGCYVKSREESHVQAADKLNDAVRVDGAQVRARIVCEGGNLGVTQRGRIEYARHGAGGAGGRINTDAVDNCGGVNLSDHEVNLKILLELLRAEGDLPTLEERNALLARLESEVAQRVLEDARGQHRAISRERLLSGERPELYRQALALLQQAGGLDGEGESIPTPETLDQWLREGGAPRPFLAVLLAYGKMLLFRRLMEAGVGDSPAFQSLLPAYFPASAAREYGEQAKRHFLRREIVTTQLTNRVMHQTGCGPLMAACAQLERAIPAERRPLGGVLPPLVRGYFLAGELLEASALRRRLEALESRAPAVELLRLHNALEELLLHLAGRMVLELGSERLDEGFVAVYAPVARQFCDGLWAALPGIVSERRMVELTARREGVKGLGAEETLATRLVILPLLRDLLGMIRIAEEIHAGLAVVGRLYLQVDDFFGLAWVEEGLRQLGQRDEWGRVAIEQVRRELVEARVLLVRSVLRFKRRDESVEEAFRRYLREVEPENALYQQLLRRAWQEKGRELLPLMVLVRQLKALQRE
ncbi:MAG: NAD-glutamate dehydrogenase [Magnetococcales bacterium]|nr:NAD-glutamate dehydrogenase [Magnetococcales bacterium]